jgi:GH15 family glucan-1,4-alpha-glucosidase
MRVRYHKSKAARIDGGMPYQPIENYGVIGNMRTVALVGMNGSVDWYCSPNFDSPSIFGAILDNRKGGRFQIAPVADRVIHKQFYWPSTNILVTRFLQEDGIAELEDFMPVGFPSNSPLHHQLYRRIRCVRGSVRISVVCQPAFDYGRKPHETQLNAQGASFHSDTARFSLWSSESLKRDTNGGVAAEFVLGEGKSGIFVFRNESVEGHAPNLPSENEAEEVFHRTVKFW